MKRKVCSLEAFISSHSTYVIQCHPVLKGTTQDIWHVSIRQTLHHNHSLTASCSHTLREPHSPLRLLQRVPHRLDLLEMTGHICAHDHLDHQRTQLPVENTAQLKALYTYSIPRRNKPPRTSSHPSRGWPGCSSHLPAWVCRLRSRGGFPEPSDRCTGWPLLICAGPKKEESKKILHFVNNFDNLELTLLVQSKMKIASSFSCLYVISSLSFFHFWNTKVIFIWKLIATRGCQASKRTITTT